MAARLALEMLLVLPHASVAFVQSSVSHELPQPTPRGHFLSQNPAAAAELETEPQAQPHSWLSSVLALGATLGLLAGLVAPAPARALTAEQYSQLTYNQVKGSGLANRCPTVESQGSSVPVKDGSKMMNFCLEPKSWAVEAETDKGTEFVTTKLLTRQTYTLAFIGGELSPSPITFKEDDGIHTLPTTVQLPNGEYVPFLFSCKGLVAQGEGSEFKPGFTWGGEFEVP
eukprot:CAMPEP_0171175638 /NCGR_PEP_ID=MMETSP0790-20130122/11329_1 /TAXON_ID=2925 /ORGANISM="Alexandrium catenella, Strain OF101" /LENGTH=227 /DNA_ID=CAMNT_0011640515 /DNA_START=92 /DNA_END=771 /DNA_ORIENTATION=+